VLIGIKFLASFESRAIMQLGDNWNRWDAAPVQQTVEYITPEPTLPIRTAQPNLFNARAFKIYGAIIALLAAASLSLGIADVVMTKEAYCTPWNKEGPMYCSTTGEPYVWTWVGSGIWGSIPIFFAGLFAMCLSADPVRWTRVFALLIFLSAIVFAPAMIVLTSIELWRGHTSMWTFYTLGSNITAGSIMPAKNPYQAKFAIPLAVTIIGGILFILTGAITIALCCCMHSIGIYLPHEIEAFGGIGSVGAGIQEAPQTVIQSKEIYYPSRPQIKNQYAIEPFQPPPANDPYSRFSALPYMPTRYNSVPNPYGSGVMYGNFPARPVQQPSSFASDFFKPNPAYFWQ
jgi:hypothetical protein